MELSVEISKYPLADDYIPAIKDFIDRLHAIKCGGEHNEHMLWIL